MLRRYYSIGRIQLAQAKCLDMPGGNLTPERAKQYRRLRETVYVAVPESREALIMVPKGPLLKAVP